jgi:PE-PPE domain
MATVLTLAGSFAPGPGYMQYAMSGEVTENNDVVDVLYNNIGLFELNVQDGVTQLNAAINATPGKKIVFGHSLGAVVAYRWIKDIGPTWPGNPADLEFVVLGNPANKYTGYLATATLPSEWIDGDIDLAENTIPVDTPYKVIDFVKQYDGWADFPNNTESPNYAIALTNTALELGFPINHINYFQESFDNPDNRSQVDGNITYTWTPSPLLGGLLGPFGEAFRVQIETAYDRPVALGQPLPPVDPGTPPAQLLEIFPPRNLLPGQYQIGNLIFGRGTTVRVESFDIKTYDVNAQDYQISRADEKRFGFDQIVPTTIEVTFHVLNNWLLPGFEDVIPNFWEDMPEVTDFQKEWKSDEIRNRWGTMKPLYVCDRKGITKMVFGRPGQFTYEKNNVYTQSVQCLGEFRRADTLAYGIEYNDVTLEGTNNLLATIDGTEGDGPSWINFIFQGPVTNPSLTFVNLYNQARPVTFKINREVLANEVIQLTGEPWTRRAVSSFGGENIAADVSEYLDKLRFGSDSELKVIFTGEGITEDTKAKLFYLNAYQVI